MRWKPPRECLVSCRFANRSRYNRAGEPAGAPQVTHAGHYAWQSKAGSWTPCLSRFRMRSGLASGSCLSRCIRIAIRWSNGSLPVRNPADSGPALSGLSRPGQSTERPQSQHARGTALGGRHGPAIVPGHPEQGVLIRVLEGELTPAMPMGSEPLPDGKIEAIAKWIERFKPAQNHVDRNVWSPFRAIGRPEPPDISQESWIRNPIDRFILARLEAEGIVPATQADRRLLMRRVCCNLIGEPPTPEEVEAFLADESADAHARFVEKLLGDSR